MRIHIIGGPGSGKTYAAQVLSRQFGIPAYDLDDLFWNRSAAPYGVRASETARDTELIAIVQESEWIIEGVYYSWLRPSFERADFIFVLRPPVSLRDYRILARFVGRKFGTIPTKRETFLDLWRLLRWNHGYDTQNLEEARALIHPFQPKIVECHSADAIVNRLTEKESF